MAQRVYIKLVTWVVSLLSASSRETVSSPDKWKYKWVSRNLVMGFLETAVILCCDFRTKAREDEGDGCDGVDGLMVGV